METHFTPQQSFELINSIIESRKQVYEENGKVILMWGLAVMVAGVGHYMLNQTDFAAKAGLIWLFTMVPMFMYTMYVSLRDGKKRSKAKEHSVIDVSGMAWLMAGLMGMLNGFIFGANYGIGFTTVLYLPFCVAALVSALTIRKLKLLPFIIGATLLVFGALYIPWNYHMLVSAGIAFLMFFIPGLILRNDYKKRVHV